MDCIPLQTTVKPFSLHDALPILFGDDKKMVRVDMSEFQDGAVAVDKMIGMPRGIVGSERGGQLTNQLRDNPYSDRKSTRLNSSHLVTSYADFCFKKKFQVTGTQ